MTCFSLQRILHHLRRREFLPRVGPIVPKPPPPNKVRARLPDEFAEQDEGCEPPSGENAGIAGPIVEGLRDHAFRRHGDERPGSVCLEDCRRVRAKVTQEVEGKSRDRRSDT